MFDYLSRDFRTQIIDIRPCRFKCRISCIKALSCSSKFRLQHLNLLLSVGKPFTDGEERFGLRSVDLLKSEVSADEVLVEDPDTPPEGTIIQTDRRTAGSRRIGGITYLELQARTDDLSVPTIAVGGLIGGAGGAALQETSKRALAAAILAVDEVDARELDATTRPPSLEDQ